MNLNRHFAAVYDNKQQFYEDRAFFEWIREIILGATGCDDNVNVSNEIWSLQEFR